MKLLITLIYLICIVNYSFAENNITFDENIQNSEVIFIGKLIDRYERLESIVINKGENKDMVYTTHVFNIEEVLKGSLTGNTIAVKLRGGYDSDLKIGAKYNKDVYYYDKDDDIQRALLFLNHDKLNDFYHSTGSSPLM